jgi:hypothetical protein
MPTSGETSANEETRRTARFSHIFARLQELQNYVFDPEITPFHSVGVRYRLLHDWANGR